MYFYENDESDKFESKNYMKNLYNFTIALNLNNTPLIRVQKSTSILFYLFIIIFIFISLAFTLFLWEGKVIFI